MYVPQSFSAALLMAILCAVMWGSWANSYKLTRDYPFPLYYWDYVVGIGLCALGFAFTLGSHGAAGEPFLANLQTADSVNLWCALLGGMIFNIANLLLVAAIDISGMAVAFPIAIGIAVVEGVLLSYALQPRGDPVLLTLGVVLALAAVLANACAYRSLSGDRPVTARLGIMVSVGSGVLMGGFPPFVASALSIGHALTPYSVAVLFALGALLCCFVANIWLMRRPLHGEPVRFAAFWRAGTRNHAAGLLGGILWGIGGCFNFISAGFLGVPISYAIGQSAPLIAALWGLLVWREFAGAEHSWVPWIVLMFVLFIAAVATLSLAHGN